MGRGNDRAHSAAAVALNNRSWCFNGQSSAKERMAGDATAVFSGLVGAAGNNIVNGIFGEGG
ncbi:hypothetical protein BMS3Bbin10_01561 [bacterium BMS3Bbin10]|nr:hypothetical protein BMS3Bbin10_01561 [bacterium BMS3Bbin10]